MPRKKPYEFRWVLTQGVCLLMKEAAGFLLILGLQYLHTSHLLSYITSSLAVGHQPYVSSIPPLFRRGETPLYIPPVAPVVPEVDRFPSSQIHLPRRPSDPLDPAVRYRLNTRSHSARMTRQGDRGHLAPHDFLSLLQIFQRLQASREETAIWGVRREISTGEFRVWSEQYLSNDRGERVGGQNETKRALGQFNFPFLLPLLSIRLRDPEHIMYLVCSPETNRLLDKMSSSNICLIIILAEFRK